MQEHIIKHSICDVWWLHNLLHCYKNEYILLEEPFRGVQGYGVVKNVARCIVFSELLNCLMGYVDAHFKK